MIRSQRRSFEPYPSRTSAPRRAEPLLRVIIWGENDLYCVPEYSVHSSVSTKAGLAARNRSEERGCRIPLSTVPGLPSLSDWGAGKTAFPYVYCVFRKRLSNKSSALASVRSADFGLSGNLAL